jgi:hypothetical protein
MFVYNDCSALLAYPKPFIPLMRRSLMAEPIDPQSMSNEEGAQRLADISRQIEDVGAELRALSPSDPSGDVAAAIRHLYLITDQHALMLESLRRRLERLEEASASPEPDAPL